MLKERTLNDLDVLFLGMQKEVYDEPKGLQHKKTQHVPQRSIFDYERGLAALKENDRQKKETISSISENSLEHSVGVKEFSKKPSPTKSFY